MQAKLIVKTISFVRANVDVKTITLVRATT